MIEVADRVEGIRPVRAVSRIHLHPDCRVGKREEGRVTVSYPEGRFRVTFSGPGKLDLEESFYSPRFGLRIGNIALAYTAGSSTIRNGFRIGLEE
jgi:uncharacterized heparinase superfamily protein